MLFALFNLLKDYLEKEEPYDLIKDYTLEEINADECLKHQHESLEEAKKLYYWWSVERKAAEKLCDAKRSEWHDLRTHKESRENGFADKAFKELDLLEQAYEDKTDEMLARLIKIRRSLWT